LVVDDDPANLEVLRVRLSTQGYEVVIAVDGDDALRARASSSPTSSCSTS
jgi:CheY-like chemotaxis protein